MIDVHAHAMPRDLISALADRGLVDLSAEGSGILHIAPEISGLTSGAAIPFPPEQYDVHARLAAMDATGVAVQIISAAPFLFASHGGDDVVAMEVARRTNDALAALVAVAPSRLAALGTVPVGRPLAADEVRRCLDELGCAGVAIGTAGAGRELDHPLNEEVWSLLAERRAFTLLHPSGVSSPHRVADYHLAQLVGFPAESALAVSRLIFGGVLDRHELVMCVAHGGGCLGTLWPRLDVGWERKQVAHTCAERPSAYRRRVYYDSCLFDSTMLRRLIEDVGTDRVMLGTDFPFDLSERDPRGAIGSLRLPADDESRLLGGNAARVLGLQTAQGAPARTAGT